MRRRPSGENLRRHKASLLLCFSCFFVANCFFWVRFAATHGGRKAKCAETFRGFSRGTQSKTIMNTIKLCEHCGKPLGPKTVQGLCPECLLKVGLGSAVGTDPQGNPPAEPKAPRFVPPAAEQLASRFPQLEILGLIGQGGMGAVYKARHR